MFAKRLRPRLRLRQEKDKVYSGLHFPCLFVLRRSLILSPSKAALMPVAHCFNGNRNQPKIANVSNKEPKHKSTRSTLENSVKMPANSSPIGAAIN